MNNTLLLGNGFSRSVAPNIKSWAELFVKNNSNITNYTLFYEKYRIENKKQEERDLKKYLVQNIEQEICNAIDKKESIAQWFGEILSNNNINNIMTTNYDKGIEYILNRCGYESDKSIKNTIVEKIYSIRRCKKYINNKTKHELTLWKIHGDIDNIKTVILGYDQYCGNLSKLISYIKGSYKSSSKLNYNVGQVSIENKCLDIKKRDYQSWAELFFFSNIHIMGFGMDFSEIDIWWLLNKRARLIIENKNVFNNIVYYSLQKYDKDNKNMNAIIDMLKSFNVEHISVDSNQTLLDIIRNLRLYNYNT